MTWRDRARFFRTSRRGTTPAVATKLPLFCFSSRPMSDLVWMSHTCPLTSLSSAPDFLLPTVFLPPCCLPSLIRSPTCLIRWVWNFFDAISRLLGRPRRLLRRDPPSGARTYWHRAWGRACRRSFLFNPVVSGLFICRVF